PAAPRARPAQLDPLPPRRRAAPPARARPLSLLGGGLRPPAVTLTGPSGSRQTGDAVDLDHAPAGRVVEVAHADERHGGEVPADRKSTRLNSSHQIISYAVFC